ncbi:MAG: hypothetical protein ACO3JG_00275 [Luteolibacter sp.]
MAIWEDNGSRIGDLTDHQLIGEGTCGAVFRVKCPQGRSLALKILDTSAANLDLLEKNHPPLGHRRLAEGRDAGRRL